MWLYWIQVWSEEKRSRESEIAESVSASLCLSCACVAVRVVWLCLHASESNVAKLRGQVLTFQCADTQMNFEQISLYRTEWRCRLWKCCGIWILYLPHILITLQAVSHFPLTHILKRGLSEKEMALGLSPASSCDADSWCRNFSPYP